jgi:endonuclease I
LHIRLRKGSRKVSYKQVWKHYEFLDRDDIQNNKLNMIYSSSPRANNHQAAKWNREHVWPKSYGVSCKNGGGYKENNGPFTDLHHLYPADIKINAKRSSRYFDTCKRIAGPDLKGRLKPDCKEVKNDGFAFPDTGYSIDGSFWMPPPKSRGIIARALFFMALRYDGEEPLTRDLKLANCPKYCRFQLGKLDALLDWHHQYPPTDEEKLRNAKVCTVQGNRNPFVDHPDLVQEFFNSSSSSPHLISTDCRPCPARDSAPVSATCSEWRN